MDGQDDLLVFFECQCQGIKFYYLSGVSMRYGTWVVLRREPANIYDHFCAAAFVCDGSIALTQRTHSRCKASLMLGHIAKEAARWLCPLLSSSLRVTGCVCPVINYVKPCKLPLNKLYSTSAWNLTILTITVLVFQLCGVWSLLKVFKW